MRRLGRAVLLLCLPAGAALAAVNPATRQFTKSFTDAELRVGPYRWALIRTYQPAQTSARALFGRGWCSTLENRIANVKGQPVLRVCGAGGEIAYRKAEGGAWVSATGLRLERKGGVYLREIESGYFERYRADGAGELLGVSARSGEALQIEWKAERPVRLTDSQGRRYQLSYSADGRLVKIQGSGENLVYKYDERGLLQGVDQNAATALRFAYDAHSRLTEMVYPDQTRLKLAYERQGEVASLTTRDGCVESFEKPKLERQGRVETRTQGMRRECPKRPAQEYVFGRRFVKNGKSGERLLASFENGPAGRQHTAYHPTLQKPARVELNGVSSFFAYDELGRLRAVRRGEQLDERDFGPGGRVAGLSRTVFDAAGTPLFRERTELSYDGRGHFTGLLRSSGEGLRIRVDADGNWRGFTDPAGRKLSDEKAYALLRAVDTELGALDRLDVEAR